MSGQIFEYFFDSAELEPYYSELTKSRTPRNASVRREKSDAAIAPGSATSREVVSAAVVEPPVAEDADSRDSRESSRGSLCQMILSAREVQSIEAVTVIRPTNQQLIDHVKRLASRE